MPTTLLIADDEPNILLSLDYLMQREGFRVVLARDGQEALDLIVRERPALALLDVMMPLCSGLEVCQQVRQDPTLDGVQILLLTAKGRESDVSKGLAMGANAYMTKPFSTRELVARVRSMLEAPP